MRSNAKIAKNLHWSAFAVAGNSKIQIFLFKMCLLSRKFEFLFANALHCDYLHCSAVAAGKFEFSLKISIFSHSTCSKRASMQKSQKFTLERNFPVQNVFFDSKIWIFVQNYHRFFLNFQSKNPPIFCRYITQEGQKLISAPRPPMAVTNAVSWRSEGIKYRKNEVFLDVIESVNMLASANGTVLQSEIVGSVKMRVYLTGMPELRLGLNDKVLFEGSGREFFRILCENWDFSGNFTLKSIKFC